MRRNGLEARNGADAIARDFFTCSKDLGRRREMEERHSAASDTDYRQLRWYLADQACWFAAFGIQSVLFPYLVVDVLGESPARIGLAQMALTAPVLALMIPGGILADRTDLRRLLIGLQTLAAVPVLVLGWRIQATGVSYVLMLGFAVMQGSVQSMVAPTREALLSRVTGAELQKGITLAMVVQFVCQFAGFSLAGSVEHFEDLGVPALLLLQATLYVIGATAASRLRPAPPYGSDRGADGAAPPLSAIRSLLAAFRQIIATRRIAPVAALMAGVGFFYIPVFNVVLPVMVRDLYDGGAPGLAMISGAFIAGVVTVSLLLVRLEPIVHQGSALFACSLAGVVLTTGFALGPAPAVFYGIIYAFGLVSGVLMSVGRTVVQENAPPELRARVLAIYSVGFLGAAPLGSFVLGEVSASTGVLTGAGLVALEMLMVLVLLAACTPIWDVRRPRSGTEIA